jgi:hypothetical protein
MLTAMFRLVLIAAAIGGFACGGCACGKSSDKASAAPPSAPEKVERAPMQPADTSQAQSGADDPSRHLQPDEGTLTIDKCDAKAGSETSVAIKVSPAAGFHMSKNYPTKLTVEAPAGVKVAKAELVAGGRSEAKGDADELSEKLVAFSVKATAEKPGTYKITGTFKFGVCDKDSCRAKKQPIAIQCAAS